MEQPENPISENSKLSITWDSVLSWEPSLPLKLKIYTKNPRTSHSLRRYKLALQYCIELISCSRNPAYNCIMKIRYENLFENKEKAIKPFNLRIQNLLSEIKINPKIIHNTILPKTAPWTINQPIIKLDLTKLSKTRTHSITFQENFLNNFPDHHHIYTDGSKQRMNVGCAAVFQNQELLKRLPNESSIYCAEAMNIIANYKSSKFIIYSDSKSVPQALQSKDSSTSLITRLLDKKWTLFHHSYLDT